MDFFEHQEIARKQTRQLVILFSIAVVLTFVAMYAASVGLMHWAKMFAGPGGGGFSTSFLYYTGPLNDELGWFDPELMLTVGLVTGLIVFIGSSIKTFQFSKGEAVATLLGGSQIPVSTTDPDSKRLLNVVEEMALASGTAVPPVYLLENEKSINAFAAGYTTHDAVIGVTRGSMELLSRDELQGVIAHEFSHILNGDMRLNMRLACLTYGILFIAETGLLLLRLPFRIAFYTSSGSDNRKGGIPFQFVIVLLALGGVLALIGSVGGFFSSLIKSAISRQREYLADSSSVQFTRNPGGITGALKKIGGLHFGSRILASHAGQASHFYFANGVGASWFGNLNTHPPLLQRIVRIDPSFDGIFPKVRYPEKKISAKEKLKSGLSKDEKGRKTVMEIATVGGLMGALVDPVRVHLDSSQNLTDSIPDPIYEAAHEPFGARALLYAILLNDEVSVRECQMQQLRDYADPMVFIETQKLIPVIDTLDPLWRLPVVDLAIPALRELIPTQFHVFRKNIDLLIECDQAVSLREYALKKVLTRHLDPVFSRQALLPGKKYTTLPPVIEHVECILAALAYTEADTYEEAREAFSSGTRQLEIYQHQFNMPDYSGCSLKEVDQALDVLQGLTPLIKRNVIYACACTVTSNENISAEEGELLRAIADSLDCPIPPFARTGNQSGR
jgi:Zn-dependent protease with chaperone function